MQIHNSKQELFKHVPCEVLPKEYGGIIPSSVMIELWKNELENKRERLLSYDEMRLLSDKGIITRRNNNGLKLEEFQGSFRKLNVD